MLYTLNRDRDPAQGIRSSGDGSFVGLLFSDGTLELQTLKQKAKPFVTSPALDFVFLPVKQTQQYVL